jgi:hypothetical protein
MRTILIVLSMSLCTFAEAQKALEWQIKMGIYTDVYSLPNLREGVYWLRVDPKVYFRTSIGLEMKKWRTLIELNVDTKLTFWNSNFNWQVNYAHVVVDSPNHVSQVGDYVEVSYSNFTILNILYELTKNDGHDKLYIGFGLAGRYESVAYISYKASPQSSWPVLVDGYNRYRFAPYSKLEYQHNISKHWFLSTHINYVWFDETPHSYWQFALNGGIRF